MKRHAKREKVETSMPSDISRSDKELEKRKKKRKLYGTRLNKVVSTFIKCKEEE